MMAVKRIFLHRYYSGLYTIFAACLLSAFVIFFYSEHIMQSYTHKLHGKPIVSPHKVLHYAYMYDHKNTKIPRSVYYLWCGINPAFTFANYLSLKSSVKFLNPERITFLYSVYPQVEKHGYNTWLEDFKEEYPYIEMKNLSWPAVKDSCVNKNNMMNLVHDFLGAGGIFIGTSTVLTQPAMYLWNEHFMRNMQEPRSGLIAASPKKTMENLQNRNSSQLLNCSFISKKASNVSIDSTCLTLSQELNPKDIWTNVGEVSNLLNLLMYNEKRTPIPHPHEEPVIPMIAHMLWLNGKPIDFLFYLSALSLLYVVHVDKLFIHGNIEPRHTGHWENLTAESRVQFISIIKPDMLFGQKTLSPHLMSDIFRAKIMNEYGGIYSDVDVLWTQPIPDKLRRYEAVASFDWAHAYPYYPDYINLGVTMGQKGAPFWKYFLKSFKSLKSDIFGFNGLLQPYKIYEYHPDSILIYPHLQVMCYSTECHPSWTNNWKSMDWKTETHAFHWTHPNPQEYKDRETLLNSSGIWADMGKFVLVKAGQL